MQLYITKFNLGIEKFKINGIILVFMRVIANNRKARYDYFLITTFEAGLVLKGSEVKSVRAGNVNLKDSFVYVKDGEVFASNIFIKKYNMLTDSDIDEKKERKLLLNKREIKKIYEQTREKGFTCIPTKLYIKNNKHVKLEIALAKGKHTYDKKQAIKEKDIAREVQRELRNYNHS